MKNTIAGIDLASQVIQVCVSTGKKVRSNEEMTPEQFHEWLHLQTPILIVFEACSTSNYWKQVAENAGHTVKLICANLVSKIRQNQKTDKNDALAIIQAASIPSIRFIGGKTHQQQQLQSIMRLRELSIKQKTALSNQISALLSEFGIRVYGRKGGLKGAVEDTLEDAENGFSFEFREALDNAWKQYLVVCKSITIYDKSLEKVATSIEDCKKLLQLEGVGMLSAVSLYNLLGNGEQLEFKTGRDASACIGLTPIQHSSGGKVKIGSIGKFVRNTLVRSYLVVGAMSAINQMMRRPARTKKEQWVKQLVSRRGKRCAAVALANKNVRTAFALLTQDTNYRAEILVA